MSRFATLRWARRMTPIVLIGAMIGLVYLILKPFFVSISWAVLLVYITWPAYRWFRHKLGARHNLSALLAVIGLTIALVLPMFWLIGLIQNDLIRIYQAGAVHLRQPQSLMPNFLIRIPWIGKLLQGWLQHVSEPTQLTQHVVQLVQMGARQLLTLLGGVGRNAAKLTFAMISIFFFYRDGEAIQREIRRALLYLIGSRIDVYIDVAGGMSRSVVQGMALSALLQGLIAGLGYWLIGLETPAILSVATAITSIIPIFGTALIWGTISIFLVISGSLWQGLAMLAWGIFLVHPIDNIIRPLLISNAAHLPFLLTMFGVIGGISAFGLIGIFVGPIILAIAVAVWREWMRIIPCKQDFEPPRSSKQ
ncbi:AI-2E family transporter [Massilia horti]|nr:AI-2E family transporter [Massilia horti]